MRVVEVARNAIMETVSEDRCQISGDKLMVRMTNYA